ncbi:hypothetical protein OG943_09505 [Amycolatopsis sp. NBC_00345]|uniref:hypothetical protein n=1 Tax=Amycolatopsis sp. NBC_00345 TaxID=2975955 RepID=UPI002E255284
MSASRGRAFQRDHVVAACLAGAVVVVVGYASGLGLKTTPAGAGTSVTAGGPPQTPAAPQEPARQPLPAGQLPPANDVQPMPAMPDVGAPPADGFPATGPVADTPSAEPAPPTTGSVPPGTEAPPPDPGTGTPTPPGNPVPDCQPGLAQPVLDTASGLPLVGDLTAGAGLTGPDGILAAILGSCRPQPETPGQPATAPAVLPGIQPTPATPASGG